MPRDVSFEVSGLTYDKVPRFLFQYLGSRVPCIIRVGDLRSWVSPLGFRVSRPGTVPWGGCLVSRLGFHQKYWVSGPTCCMCCRYLFELVGLENISHFQLLRGGYNSGVMTSAFEIMLLHSCCFFLVTAMLWKRISKKEYNYGLAW